MPSGAELLKENFFVREHFLSNPRLGFGGPPTLGNPNFFIYHFFVYIAFIRVCSTLQDEFFLFYKNFP